MPPPPLRTVRKKPSRKNCRWISAVVAPSALRTPISRVRSFTATSMMFVTPMPPSASVTMPTMVKKSFMWPIMRPNISVCSEVSHIEIACWSAGSKP